MASGSSNSVADQAWSNVFAMFEDVLDSYGNPMGKRGRTMAGRLKKVGMSAKEAEAVHEALKGIQGDPWPYVTRYLAGWIAERDSRQSVAG